MLQEPDIHLLNKIVDVHTRGPRTTHCASYSGDDQTDRAVDECRPCGSVACETSFEIDGMTVCIAHARLALRLGRA